MVYIIEKVYIRIGIFHYNHKTGRIWNEKLWIN